MKTTKTTKKIIVEEPQIGHYTDSIQYELEQTSRLMKMLGKQLFECLVAERVGEVLRHALETAETSVAPLGAVGGDDTSVFVESISIGGKHGRHREGVFL